MDVNERICDECDVSQPIRAFINYKEPVSKGGTKCRDCRENTPVAPKRVCPGCQKMRRAEAFRQPHELRNDAFQDARCRQCRRNIEREWTRGRWKLEGYTSMPARSHNARVRCDTCLIVLYRSQVLKHNRIRCAAAAAAPVI